MTKSKSRPIPTIEELTIEIKVDDVCNQVSGELKLTFYEALLAHSSIRKKTILKTRNKDYQIHSITQNKLGMIKITLIPIHREALSPEVTKYIKNAIKVLQNMETNNEDYRKGIIFGGSIILSMLLSEFESKQDEINEP